MEPVALTAREHAALLLLVGTREVEAGHVGAGVDLAVAQRDEVAVLRDDLVDRLLGVNRLVLLVYVGQLDRRPDAEGSRRGLLEPHNHPEEGRLARTVGADDADDAGGRQREVQMLVEHAVAESLRDIVRLDDHVAQTRTVGDEDFELLLLLLGILVEHLVVGRQSGLRLGVAAGGRHAHPLQLAFERLAALRLLLLLHLQTLGLLLKPARVVALPGDALAAVELQNPTGHVVQEVTVVRHGDDRTLVLLEVLLEPVNRLGVEVVRRLVEQQHVGLLQQQTAQRHAAPLTARKHLDRLVGVGAAQGVHRTLEHAVQLPAVHVVNLLVELALALDEARHRVVVHRLAELHVNILVLLEQGYRGGAPLFDHLADGLRIVELGLLLQIAHRIAGRKDHLALEVLVDAGNNLHEGRLSGAVQTDDADFGSVEEGEVDVVQHFFLVGEGLTHTHHREDDFFVCHIWGFTCFA